MSLALDRTDSAAHHRLLVRPLDIEFYDLCYEVPSGPNNRVLCSAMLSPSLYCACTRVLSSAYRTNFAAHDYCKRSELRTRIPPSLRYRGEAHSARTARALPERQPHRHYGSQRRRQNYFHERHRRLPVRSTRTRQLYFYSLFIDCLFVLFSCFHSALLHFSQCTLELTHELLSSLKSSRKQNICFQSSFE